MLVNALAPRYGRSCTATTSLGWPQAGVPRIRLHSVRDAVGTKLNQLGIPRADAAALGHTVGVYVHLRETYRSGCSQCRCGPRCPIRSGPVEKM